MIKSIFYTIAIYLCAYSLQAQSWSELAGLNGFGSNNSIYAISSDQLGNIYAVGTFTNSSGNYYVAKWNGITWSELGGLNGLAANGNIYSICSDAIGNIYACGSFKNGSGKYYVAKWDGNVWSELGGLNVINSNSDVRSICTDAVGNVYAAWISGLNYFVAKWNGSLWSSLGGLGSFNSSFNFLNLCSDPAGNIYVAGGVCSTAAKYFVAKYDGSSWSELGGVNGLSSQCGILSICCDASGNIYATANNGATIGPSCSYHVSKYNGSGWSVVGNINGIGFNTGINSICSDKWGNIYAGGNIYNNSLKRCVAKYDGNTWSELGGNNSLAAGNSIFSVCNDKFGNIYAGGYFVNSSGKPYVAKYNLVTGLNHSEIKSASLKVSPNPACITSAISFSLAKAQKVCFKILNMDGSQSSLIMDNPCQLFNQGENEITLDFEGLKAGVYVLQMQTDEIVLREKVVVRD